MVSCFLVDENRRSSSESCMSTFACLKHLLSTVMCFPSVCPLLHDTALTCVQHSDPVPSRHRGVNDCPHWSCGRMAHITRLTKSIFKHSDVASYAPTFWLSPGPQMSMHVNECKQCSASVLQLAHIHLDFTLPSHQPSWREPNSIPEYQLHTLLTCFRPLPRSRDPEFTPLPFSFPS